MSRPTRHHPERGDARTRLLDAARDIIRRKGYPATSVDELCEAAEVTKGSFFHHFDSKEAMGVAAAEHWTAQTSEFFLGAPYHRPADPLERVLAYVSFRREMIEGELWHCTCLAGTVVQDVYLSSPAIRDACARSILGHAETLEADIGAALAAHNVPDVEAASLARHIQGVIQGAFVLAKAENDPALGRDSLGHLERYLRLLFAAR